MLPDDDSAGDPALITIVLADDHVVVRHGLRLVLEGEDGLHVVAEAGDVADAMRYVRAHRPSVLVLDLNMPGEPSLPRHPALPRGLAGHGDRRADDAGRPRVRARGAARRARSATCSRRPPTTSSSRRSAPRGRGDTYLNPRLGARLAAEPPQPAGPPDDLSEREVEVLRLIALGHTNAEIGKQLYLSVRTVETHRAHIQQKLRRTSRAELVRYALDHGLVG